MEKPKLPGATDRSWAEPVFSPDSELTDHQVTPLPPLRPSTDSGWLSDEVSPRRRVNSRFTSRINIVFFSSPPHLLVFFLSYYVLGRLFHKNNVEIVWKKHVHILNWHRHWKDFLSLRTVISTFLPDASGKDKSEWPCYVCNFKGDLSMSTSFDLFR